MSHARWSFTPTPNTSSTRLEKGWAKGWKARGWVKGDKKPALNPDLWERLLELCDSHTKSSSTG